MNKAIQKLLFNKKKYIGDLLSIRATTAYGYRLLYGNYKSALITVRKTVATIDYYADIYANSNGDLDTNALLSFANSGDVFIQKHYDLTGNGYDQIQNTNANQPKIVVGGALNLKGLRPAALLTGAEFSTTVNWSNSNLFGGAASTMNLVGISSSGGDQDFISYGSSTAQGLRSLGGQGTAWRAATGTDISSSTVTLQTFATVTGTYSAGINTLYTQGVSRGTGTSTENTPITELFLGRRSNGGSGAAGSLSESWIFPDILSANDLLILHQNQSAYFGITLG